MDEEDEDDPLVSEDDEDDSMKEGDWCRWKCSETLTMAGEKVEISIRQSAPMLGRLIGPDPSRHTAQVRWARQKAATALKVLSWMGAFAESSPPDLAHTLYTYLVESVLVTMVLNTHLSPADYDRNMAGKRVPQWIALRENGWDPIDMKIWSRKMGLMNAIKALDQRTYPKMVQRIRMAVVAAGGEHRGLCAETLDLWTRAGHRDKWRETTGSKLKYKREIKEIVKILRDMARNEQVRQGKTGREGMNTYRKMTGHRRTTWRTELRRKWD